MADDRFTPDEILMELRRRAREDAGPAGARTALPAREPRARAIADEPAPALAAALKRGQRAIYGIDDRKEAFEAPPAVRPLSAATVALVQANDLDRVDGQWRLSTSLFRDEYNLCPDEPFGTQPLGCFCSGVLVAPNVIATAGHCIDSSADLARIRFVFGFQMLRGAGARLTFGDDDVYTGVKLLGRKLTADGTDWAVVRLDRTVVGRKPVRLRASGKIQAGDEVFVIGHPCGLPQKYAPGATVRQNANPRYFVANLDTYGGNSGSPVFSRRTRQLEGLLVRGQTDFVKVGNCNISQVFPSTGSGGEDVTRTSVWSSFVGAKKTATPARPKRKTAKKKGRR